MNELLDIAAGATKGRISHPSFISINPVVNKNLNLIRGRVRTSARAVKPDNILYQILIGLGIDSTVSESRLRWVVKKQARSLAAALRITSPSSYGEAKYDNILRGGSEMYIFTYDNFTRGRWENYKPIEFVYHTNTNVNYDIGSADDSNSIAFIKINVYMLAVQYLDWLEWVKNSENYVNTYNFLACYPLYNAIESYMDVSLFNRHYYRIIGKPIPEEPDNPEYVFSDIEDRLDDSNVKLLNLLVKTDTNTAGVINNIPAFFHESAAELYPSFNGVVTDQVEWYHIAVQLPYIHAGLALTEQYHPDQDTALKTSLKRLFKVIKGKRILANVPKHIQLHIIGSYIEKITKML